MGLLHLGNHVAQNCQTGEQMMHWNMLNIQRKFKFGGFVWHIPVRHLLSSLAILHYVITQMQWAQFISSFIFVPIILGSGWIDSQKFGIQQIDKGQKSNIDLICCDSVWFLVSSISVKPLSSAKSTET